MKQSAYRKIIAAVILGLLLTVSSGISLCHAAEVDTTPGTVSEDSLNSYTADAETPDTADAENSDSVDTENPDAADAGVKASPTAGAGQEAAVQDTSSGTSSDEGQTEASADIPSEDTPAESDQSAEESEVSEDTQLSDSGQQDEAADVKDQPGQDKELTPNQGSAAVSEQLAQLIGPVNESIDQLDMKFDKLEKKERKSFIPLMITAAVLLVIILGLVVLNIILLKKHENLLSLFEKLTDYIINSNRGNTDVYDLKLSLESVRKDMSSLNKSLNEIVQSMNMASTEEQKQNNFNQQRDNRLQETQFSSDFNTAKNMSKSEIFLDKYNKYLAGEISWSDFQWAYKVEDEIQFEIDIENNRATKLASVGSQGHIQVFNKSSVDGQNSVALLKKNEFPAFYSSQVLNMIYTIFEIQGSTDFANGKVTCIQPAQVQKSQGIYRVIKKGVYSIQ